MMTLDEIKKRLDAIRKGGKDSHADICTDFVRHVASSKSNELSPLAKEIIEEVDFIRRYESHKD